MAFVADSNRPHPLLQPPATACLPASGAASEVPSRLVRPCLSPAEGTCTAALSCAPPSRPPLPPRQAAEKLYTAGYISYPRTETTAYSPSFDLRAVLREQSAHPNWGKTAAWLLRSTKGAALRAEGGRDAGDHPPITPMRTAERKEFAKNTEWRVYDYVARHFIASLMADLRYVERRLLLDIGGHEFAYVWHEVCAAALRVPGRVCAGGFVGSKQRLH